MSNHLSSLGGISSKEGSVGDKGTNNVGVDVRGGASILDVALTVVLSGAGGDTEGSSTIGNTVGEFFA